MPKTELKYIGDAASYKNALSVDLDSLEDALKSNCGYELVKCEFVLTGDKKPEAHIIAKSIYEIEEDK